MVVNAGDLWSRLLSSYLHSRVSFPVYEDWYAASPIWETLNGAKDDMLVYDRCGYLTYHLRMPYSFLDLPHVGMAIRSTHYGADPCNCTLPVPVWNLGNGTMDGNTNSSVDNTNSTAENNTVVGNNTEVGNNSMVGNNTEVNNNTLVENVEAPALNSTTNTSSEVELDVSSTGDEEETKKANKTREALKRRYRHLVKHHSHHDEDYPRAK